MEKLPLGGTVAQPVFLKWSLGQLTFFFFLIFTVSSFDTSFLCFAVLKCHHFVVPEPSWTILIQPLFQAGHPCINKWLAAAVLVPECHPKYLNALQPLYFTVDLVLKSGAD